MRAAEMQGMKEPEKRKDWRNTVALNACGSNKRGAESSG
jgi:hypothetical protein